MQTHHPLLAINLNFPNAILLRFFFMHLTIAMKIAV